MNQLRQPRPNESPRDLVGRRFGRLTVIAHAEKRRRRVYWRVKCDCGTEVDKQWASIRDGVRCGRCTPIIHGHAKRSGFSPEYRSWAAMVQRATNPNNPDADAYSGRGISVCDRWLDFEKFLADMGPKPTAKHEIERSDNDLGYTKENCIWETRGRQNRNRRNTHRIIWRGKSIALIDACESVGISYSIVKQRIKLGWNLDLAMSTPRLEYGQRKPK